MLCMLSCDRRAMDMLLLLCMLRVKAVDAFFTCRWL